MRRITISFPWPLSEVEMRDVLTFAFQSTLVTYLGFYFIESLQPGFITTSISLNTILWWVIVLGVGATLWPAVTQQYRSTPRLTYRKILQICTFALFSAVVVYLQTGQALGKLSLFIAICVGLIVVGVCYLLYFDGEESRKHLSGGE